MELVNRLYGEGDIHPISLFIFSSIYDENCKLILSRARLASCAKYSWPWEDHIAAGCVGTSIWRSILLHGTMETGNLCMDILQPSFCRMAWGLDRLWNTLDACLACLLTCVDDNAFLQSLDSPVITRGNIKTSFAPPSYCRTVGDWSRDIPWVIGYGYR